MKRVKTAQGISSLGTILSVWAHPDDESFLAAGLLAAAVQNGQKVICVTATKGEAGFDYAKGWDPKTLGQVRAAEMVAALKIIGITRHHWLGYPDGGCSVVPDEDAVGQLMKLIDQYQPDTILTFPPDGITGHPDHQAVSRWSSQAIVASKKPITLYYAVDTKEKYDSHLKDLDEQFNIYFNIDEPKLVPANQCDLCFDVPKDLLKRKVQALVAMTSQTAGMFDAVGQDWFVDALKSEAFVRADRADISW